MAKTTVRSLQIKDGEVKRSDVNITQTGEALIRRLIAGTNISISSTGVDTGTGDVTVSVSSTPNFTTLSINGTQILDSSRNLLVTSVNVVNSINVQGLAGYYSFYGRADLGLFGNGNYSLALQSPNDISINIDSNNNDTGAAFRINTNTIGITGGINLLTLHENGNLSLIGNITQAGTNLNLVINSTSATTNSYLGFQRSGTLKGVFGNSWAADNLINGSVQDDMCIRNSRDILFSCNGGTNLHARLTSTEFMLGENIVYGATGQLGITTQINIEDKQGTIHLIDVVGGIITSWITV